MPFSSALRQSRVLLRLPQSVMKQYTVPLLDLETSMIASKILAAPQIWMHDTYQAKHAASILKDTGEQLYYHLFCLSSACLNSGRMFFLCPRQRARLKSL